MQEARILGNRVYNLATQKGISSTDLCNTLDCNEQQLFSFYKGYALPSFSQLQDLAGEFDITIDQLLSGDIAEYNKTVVHCTNKFQDAAKRKKILDIIDAYVDIINAVETS